MQRLKTIFYDQNLPVQRRCFHWLLFISGITCIMGATADVLTSFNFRTIIFTYASAFITFFFLFMASRAKNILLWQFISCAFYLFIFFPQNYLTSYGFNGVTVFFIIMFVVAIALALEGNLRKVFFILALLVTVALIWLQIFRPGIFADRPEDPIQVGINFSLALIIVLSTIYGLIRIVMRSYAQERRQVEIERAKAEEAARVKADFLASMSHEIRTPMNAILGIASILSRSPLSEEQKKYLDDMRGSATSLLSIINDILDFSKIEAGKFELVPIHFNLKKTLDNICALTTFTARGKNLQFHSAISDDLPDAIFADENRLRQILNNLLGNAVKYTAEGSVTLKVSREGDSILYAITDTGVGIREKDAEAIFQAFQQIDMRRNRNVEGTGLGLSICKTLCLQMDGKLWVESEYGKGSTFFAQIPFVPGNLAEVQEESEESSFQAPQAKVLVVDDNAINLTVAAGLLEQFGIRAALAESGQEAIDKVSCNDYDLVFMDHMMPMMDGIEATGHIRGMGGRCALLPIVALTANAIVGMEKQFLEAGMDDFLAKPIENAKLEAILRKYIKQEDSDERISN